MHSFDVLNSRENLFQRRMLEASAGTGKTFSIENIVVRLLIEEPEDQILSFITVEQILVVTFTRAATRELKLRIRKNIEKIYHLLVCASQGLLDEAFEKECPEYIKKICLEGKERIRRARKNLQRALFSFEEAQIFTIHSFCSRVLKEKFLHYGVEQGSLDEEKTVSVSDIYRVIRDFLRIGLSPNHYSSEQIVCVLKSFSNDTDRLVAELYSLFTKGMEIESFRSFEDSYKEFLSVLSSIKKETSFESQELMDAFIVRAPFYKGLCDRSKSMKKEVFQELTSFTSLIAKDCFAQKDFNLLIKSGVKTLKKFHDSNLRKNSSLKEAPYGELISNLLSQLLPILEEACSGLIILARMGKDCAKVLQEYFEKEQLLTHDDILKEMYQALHEVSFVDKVRVMYKAAIIDEFQDTDPVQWGIFKKLFQERKEKDFPFILVGDPKQSIYGFRRADIYTYLDAAKSLGNSAVATLDTNFRSQEGLVRALNTLFSEETLPDFMCLPRTEEKITFRSVKSSSLVDRKEFSDSWGYVHFFLAQAELNGQSWPNDSLLEGQLFPFITGEVKKLRREEGMQYSQCAILVRDRYEAEKLQLFFNQRGIPSHTSRSFSLVHSEAYCALKELLLAVVRYESSSALSLALGGRILKWTHLQVKEFNQGKNREFVLRLFHRLNAVLENMGFSAFIQELFQSQAGEGELSIEQKILREKGGVDFYSSLQQLCELFVENYREKSFSTESILSFFQLLERMDEDDDERMKMQQKGGVNSVHILTLHMSKGLEFDVVFALGLAKRTKVKKGLIPCYKEEGPVLSPCSEDSDQSISFYQEVDAEKMRQLYVGMTRAKYRLYVPMLVDHKNKAVDFGEASPMELFLSRLGQSAGTYQEYYSRLPFLNEQVLEEFIQNEGSFCDITFSFCEETELDLREENESLEKVDLLPPREPKIPASQFFVESFSSIHSQLGSGREVKTRLKKSQAPSSWEEPFQSGHTLPAGSFTGNLLHMLLEKISFSRFLKIQNAEDCLDLIRPYLFESKLIRWEKVLAQMVYHALTEPLLVGENGFNLKDVDSKKMYKELEFLYPLSADIYKKLKPSTANVCDGMLKGFIDLVFEHLGSYYILDWKSNWLGPGQEYYTQSNLKKVMEESDYFLQADIYTHALKRYLKLLGIEDFKSCFGGVFYFFLRGANSKNSSLSSVYHIMPDELLKIETP